MYHELFLFVTKKKDFGLILRQGFFKKIKFFIILLISFVVSTGTVETQSYPSTPSRYCIVLKTNLSYSDRDGQLQPILQPGRLEGTKKNPSRVVLNPTRVLTET